MFEAWPNPLRYLFPFAFINYQKYLDASHAIDYYYSWCRYCNELQNDHQELPLPATNNSKLLQQFDHYFENHPHSLPLAATALNTKTAQQTRQCLVNELDESKKLEATLDGGLYATPKAEDYENYRQQSGTIVNIYLESVDLLSNLLQPNNILYSLVDSTVIYGSIQLVSTLVLGNPFGATGVGLLPVALLYTIANLAGGYMVEKFNNSHFKHIQTEYDDHFDNYLPFVNLASDAEDDNTGTSSFNNININTKPYLDEYYWQDESGLTNANHPYFIPEYYV